MNILVNNLNLISKMTKITTMLLKATRYIIFLVFFQVSSIIILISKLKF